MPQILSAGGICQRAKTSGLLQRYLVAHCSLALIKRDVEDICSIEYNKCTTDSLEPGNKIFSLTKRISCT